MTNGTRLASVDIFRGITIAFMIVVNSPGSWDIAYPPLTHSAWHGCSPADMVFPFFLFISGVSMWLSFKKYDHELNTSSFIRITRRVISIFALGLFLNIFPFFGMDYTFLRIMGVLQRIALAYGIAAFICITVNRDFLWVVTGLTLLLYWAALAWGGGSDPYSLEGNLVLRVDRAIMGENHLYTGYGIPFDPEGLLSTIPAVCTVIIGYYTGWIMGRKTSSGTFLKMMVIGLGLTGLGLLWNRFLPFNKPLWTSSYTLYTTGLAMIGLSVVYWLADVIKFRKWGIFFMIFGTNALFAFFLSEAWMKILDWIQVYPGGSQTTLHSLLYGKIFMKVAGDLNGSLLFAGVQMLLIWSITLILYRRKIFIRF